MSDKPLVVKKVDREEKKEEVSKNSGVTLYDTAVPEAMKYVDEEGLVKGYRKRGVEHEVKFGAGAPWVGHTWYPWSTEMSRMRLVATGGSF